MLDGCERTSPVKRFSPNGYGLYDMAGNVWEWTADPFTPDHSEPAHACCAPEHGRPTAGETFPRRVTKGGSHLCAPNYCLRYRPAARSPQSQDSATTHIGFRCVADLS